MVLLALSPFPPTDPSLLPARGCLGSGSGAEGRVPGLLGAAVRGVAPPVSYRKTGDGGMVGRAWAKEGNWQPSSSTPGCLSTRDRGQEYERGKPLPDVRLFIDRTLLIHLPGPSLPVTWPVVLPDAVQASLPPGSLPDLMSEASRAASIALMACSGPISP